MDQKKNSCHRQSIVSLKEESVCACSNNSHNIHKFKFDLEMLENVEHIHQFKKRKTTHKHSLISH